MNLAELNGGKGTILQYFETSIPLTLVTIWVVIALQSRFILKDPDASMWKRFLWPITLLAMLFCWRKRKRDEEEAREEKEAMNAVFPSTV
jgi:hypothetical protein